MEDIINLINGPGGALVLMLVVIWTGVRQYWVFGWLYKQEREEKEQWKEAALRGTRVAERVVSVTEEKVTNDGKAL